MFSECHKNFAICEFVKFYKTRHSFQFSMPIAKSILKYFSFQTLSTNNKIFTETMDAK